MIPTFPHWQDVSDDYMQPVIAKETRFRGEIYRLLAFPPRTPPGWELYCMRAPDSPAHTQIAVEHCVDETAAEEMITEYQEHLPVYLMEHLL